MIFNYITRMTKITCFGKLKINAYIHEMIMTSTFLTVVLVLGGIYA